MRKIIAVFLALSLCLGVLPISSFASESVEFTTICIEQERPRQYTVIRSGGELLFSGEDLAALGGYSYHIEEDDAYFIRGEKTLRVDLDENYLYPFYQESFKPYSNKVALQHGIQEVQGIYFFPGSQILPWLSVTCTQVEGTLKVVRDEVSVWELTNTFRPETYAFDFLSCCKELGINDKWTKALSYIQDKGLSMILDIMPVSGTTAGAYNDYYALLEGILQDKTCTEYAVKELTGDAGRINKWLDIIESLEDESQLPDELQVFSSIVKALDSVPVKYTADLALYLSTFALDNEDKLNALKYLVIMQPEYQFPEAMSRAAENIVLEYSDMVLGVLGKSIDTLLDEVLGMIGDYSGGAFKAALKLIGLPGMVASDSASGINKIDKFSMLADCCLRAYNQENDGHVSVMDIQELRSYAFLYLYSCEQNWSAMEKYAREKEKYELADNYAQKAQQAENMASQFLSSAFSQTNDSDEYGNNNLRMKREYSKLLLNIFSEISYLSTTEQPVKPQYDAREILSEWYLSQYTQSDLKKALLVDVTHDGQVELIVVTKDTDSWFTGDYDFAFTGEVYTVDAYGSVQQIELLSFDSPVFGWYLKKTEQGYNLIEETRGVQTDCYDADFAEYYLDSQGNRIVVIDASVSSTDDKDWEQYQEKRAYIEGNVSVICFSAKFVVETTLPLDENMILDPWIGAVQSEPDSLSTSKRITSIYEHNNDWDIVYTFTYDAAGKVVQMVENRSGKYFETSEIEPLQVTHIFMYDEAGRVILHQSDNYLQEKYSYNSQGLLEYHWYSYMTTGEAHYTYDSLDRLVEEEHEDSGIITRVEYIYGDNGKLNQVITTTILNGQSESEVFNRGDVYTEDSIAANYFKRMTEPPTEDESYFPFVIYSGSREDMVIIDTAENQIFSLFLHEPNYITDESGTLIRIVDTSQEYDFYYEDITEN